MELQIKSIRLIDFKGVKDAAFQFGKNTDIFCENGAGKSTIATAFYWVFCDKSVELVSNPPVKPNNAEECKPRVEILAEIDGREISIAKEQKIKIKEDKDIGKTKVTSSNTYEINAVEKNERDFKAYLTDLNVDFQKLLFLSHPDVFTLGMNEKKARTEMRDTLFSMGEKHSDLEIAKKSNSTKDVAELLEKGYKVEEIEAMQNATIRKIKENYGKDGEILRAKIEGLENAKVDIDVAELELGRNELREQIAENKAKQENVEKQYEEFNSVSASVIELKAKQSELERVANLDLVKKKNELEVKKANLESELRAEKSKYSINKQIQEKNKDELLGRNAEREQLLANVKVAKERKFDENSLVCPYCKQEYPADKKEQLRADFETQKQSEVNGIIAKGKAVRAIIDRLISENSEYEIEIAESEKKIKVFENTINDLYKQIDSLPKSIDVSDSDDYKAIQKQIDEAKAISDKGFSADNARQKLMDESRTLNGQLLEIEKQIAKAENNVEIDEKISELLEKQKQYEVSKANAEKILEQLKELSKRKNELLVNEINAHFDIVRWALFDYQKNGEYKEVCIPTIDGKRFKESTNTGREVLAKLDIIKGLQKFYGQSYPVFLDGAECLSSKTKKRIDMECQMIYLNVSEDKELKIRVE